MKLWLAWISLLWLPGALAEDAQLLVQTHLLSEPPSMGWDDELEELDAQAVGMLLRKKKEEHDKRLRKKKKTRKKTKRVMSHTHACNVDEKHFFNESNCDIFESQSACEKARSQVTWLVSYPCSGNTWTRTVVESVTSIYTGSVFQDPILKHAGMLGEFNRDPKEVLLVKSHVPVLGPEPHIPLSDDLRAVVIMRSPLQAALSWTQWYSSHGGHSKELPYDTLKANFKERRTKLFTQWKEFADMWVSHAKDNNNVLLLKYEDIVKDARAAYLKQILPFLGIDAQRADIKTRLDCAMHSADENLVTRRNHTYTFQFDEEDKEAARSIIGDSAQDFGYVF